MQLVDFRKKRMRETEEGSVSRCSRQQNITAALEGTPPTPTNPPPVQDRCRS